MRLGETHGDFFFESPCFLSDSQLSAQHPYTLLVAREESSHPFLLGFSEFPKELIEELILDGPYGDATHGSALVRSSQDKALSMSRHTGTT